MQQHTVRVWPSTEAHPREDELAWKLAEVAADPAPLDPDALLASVRAEREEAPVPEGRALTLAEATALLRHYLDED